MAGTASKVINIRRGLDLHWDGAPRQTIVAGPPVTAVAVLGADYPGQRFDVQVEPGEAVAAGQSLLRDRKHPERVVVAPVAGRVAAVTRGARRSIDTVEVTVAGDAVVPFALPDRLDRDSLCTLLLASGLWAALRARPFDRPADLSMAPEALFVTAIDTRPHAPDPSVIIGAHAGWFGRGLAALTLLTDGETYLCHAAGAEIAGGDGVTSVAFAGRHPAGLASTHIHHLHPLNRASRIVWQIGYQDVIALGHLLETGHIWSERIVALSGPVVSSPELVRTFPGVSLSQLLAVRRSSQAARIISGSPLDGRVQAFLSRGHQQVFVDRHQLKQAPRHGVRHLLRELREAGIPALIPNAAHERAAPIGVLAVPFLRALSVGDLDMAQRLGALELVEEDMALLTLVNGEKADFGAMLRTVLDELEESA